MPHDKNGNVLSIGDEVIMRGKVTSLVEGTETCNAVIATDNNTLTVHAKDLEKVEGAQGEGQPAIAEEPEPAKAESTTAVDQPDGGGEAATT